MYVLVTSNDYIFYNIVSDSLFISPVYMKRSSVVFMIWYLTYTFVTCIVLTQIIQINKVLHR